MPKELNENAKKWVAALRSGEYTQAQQQLRIGDGYCCLGVLCDLYSKEVGGQWKELHGRSSFLGSDLTLPREVFSWAGLATGGSHFTDITVPEGDPYRNTQLSARNDHGATFAQIADIIESQPEGLFV